MRVMGDFNAKAGSSRIVPITGSNGLDEINTSSKRLLNLCVEHEVRLVNIWYRHHPRGLCTIHGYHQMQNVKPNCLHRHSPEMEILHQKLQNIGPEVDCYTDHNLLVATMKVRLNN